MTDLEKLKELAEQRGLTVTELQNGHVQVRGFDTVMVNYWPTSKNKTAHVDGVKGSVSHCTPFDVIKMAVKLPKVQELGDCHRKARINRIKDELDAVVIDHTITTPPWDE